MWGVGVLGLQVFSTSLTGFPAYAPFLKHVNAAIWSLTGAENSPMTCFSCGRGPEASYRYCHKTKARQRRIMTSVDPLNNADDVLLEGVGDEGGRRRKYSNLHVR